MLKSVTTKKTRQAGIETTQLAVNTHCFTDLAIGLARLLRFDLCAPLREIQPRHLFVPRGRKVPEEIAAVGEARVETAQINDHWNNQVYLAASMSSRHAAR